MKANHSRQRWTLLVVMCVLLVGGLVACGGDDSGDDGTTTPPDQVDESAGDTSDTNEAAAEEVQEGAEEVAGEATAETDAEPAAEGEMATTLRVAVVRGAMNETMEELATKYEEQNPDVDITVEEEPEGGAFEALIAAGNQPDLIVASFGPQVGTLAAKEAVVPLEDMPGAQELFGQLEPATLEQTYGHNYYVPIGADVTMMIYNKELFEAAGLDPETPPETWDEFLSAAEAIDNLESTDSCDEVHGTVFWNEALAWGGWYWNMLQPIYLNANQGECQLLNRLGTDVVFEDDTCQLQQFFEFNRQAQQYAPPTMEQNFFSRCMGMWPQYGYSWEPNLETAEGEPMVIGEDVGIAPIPVPNAGDTHYTTYGGRALMILKTAPDRQARAWDFLQFLMEEENNRQFITELGYLPVLTSLKDDPYFQEPERKPFVEALDNGVLPQQFAAADAVANQLLGIYQQTAVEGDLDPQEAVSTAGEESRAALDELQ